MYGEQILNFGLSVAAALPLMLIIGAVLWREKHKIIKISSLLIACGIAFIIIGTTISMLVGKSFGNVILLKDISGAGRGVIFGYSFIIVGIVLFLLKPLATNSGKANNP